MRSVAWRGKNMSLYKKGQVIVLKSNRAVQGAIVDVIEDSAETRYQVFTSEGLQTCYESQIESESIEESIDFVDAERFHANITASLIRNPSLSSLYSLNSAKIDFIPHQFRPVLKFIRSDRPRLLIADGVGVGKTIEAGLILKELEARRNLDSVLIICPRPLVSERKWEAEMERFGEDFTALNGETFRYCINELKLEGAWPEKYKKAVIPYSLFDESNIFGNSRRPGLLAVDPPKFDLVIVDEAHHIRNTATYAYKAVDRFCESAEAAVMLTATPVQLHQDDLFVLLNVLRPDLIIDKKTFYDMSEPNEFINAASAAVRNYQSDWQKEVKIQMIAAENTAWGAKVFTGNPTFNRVKKILSQGDVTPEERVQLISDIESLHTFSNIINRTRRRDIGEFTIRKPYTVKIEFTPYQRMLHDEILDVIHDIFSKIHCTENIKFMMTTIRRQTASCLFGLAPMLESILYRHVYEIMDDDGTFDAGSFDIDEPDILLRIKKILKLAGTLPKEDPKFDAMLKVIEKKQFEQKNRIMIFSSFKHTLHYLEKKLTDNGFRVGLIDGDVPDEDRRMLRKRFNPQETPTVDDSALDILLFSEVGCEGLDYQFCDFMINYDLPWNPMRIEQRIGRIDRNGQTSESVSIYNMITEGTVDADIYERCMLRIGVFNSSIGDSEEILGDAITEIQMIANDFSLTDEERREKLQQMTDNKIRYVREQAELEEKQRSLFGIKIPESSFDTELKNATNYWLSPEMLQNMVLMYLRARLEPNKEYFIGGKDLKRLRLSQENRLALLEDFRGKNFARNEITKSFRKLLESGDQLIDVTFESACWRENPSATFLTVTHPLVRMAADFLQGKNKIASSLTAQSSDVPAGTYPFAIYQWKLLGEREDLQLKPLSSEGRLNRVLFDLLKASVSSNKIVNADVSIWNDVENKHHEVWEMALKEHQSYTDELIKYKEASLLTSHMARMATLNEQLGKSDKATYIQLTQGKINTAQNDFDFRMSMLDKAKEKSDILFELLAYGLLEIQN